MIDCIELGRRPSPTRFPTAVATSVSDCSCHRCRRNRHRALATGPHMLWPWLLPCKLPVLANLYLFSAALKMGNGEMATGAILCAVAAALGWSYLASLWASGLENCLPFLFVVLALAAASGWNFLGLGSDGSLSDGAASTGRHQLPGQGGHSPGLPPATLSPSQQRRRAEERPGARQQPSLPPPLQQQAQGQGQEAQLRRGRRGSSTRPLLEAAGQEVELARMGGVSRPGSRRVVTAVPGNGSAGSSTSASSQTLMPDHSLVLVQGKPPAIAPQLVLPAVQDQSQPPPHCTLTPFHAPHSSNPRPPSPIAQLIPPHTTTIAMSCLVSYAAFRVLVLLCRRSLTPHPEPHHLPRLVPSSLCSCQL